MDDNKQFWERFSRHCSGFIRRSQTTYQQICKSCVVHCRSIFCHWAKQQRIIKGIQIHFDTII